MNERESSLVFNISGLGKGCNLYFSASLGTDWDKAKEGLFVPLGAAEAPSSAVEGPGGLCPPCRGGLWAAPVPKPPPAAPGLGAARPA